MGYGPPSAGKSHRKGTKAKMLSIIFQFELGELNRSSSCMCGRWHLPKFLLGDGTLILVKLAYLIVIVRFLASLSTVQNLTTLVWLPVVLKWLLIRVENLRYSCTSLQMLLQIHQYILCHTSTLVHLHLYITLLFWCLCLGRHQVVLDGSTSFVISHIPCLLQIFMPLSLSSLVALPCMCYFIGSGLFLSFV